MKIVELLKKETMILDLRSTTKNEVIEELANELDRAGRLNDRKKFIEEIHNRESQSSTGIGDGIAIPHAKTNAVKEPTIVFGRSKSGIEYDSLDGNPSHLFFMIAASEGANNEHLQTLSRLSTLLIDEDFREILMKAETQEEILTAINEKEIEKLGSEDEEASKTDAPEKFIVAVTGCPTGIAHTYMRVQSLNTRVITAPWNAKAGLVIEYTCHKGFMKREIGSSHLIRASPLLYETRTSILMRNLSQNCKTFNGRAFKHKIHSFATRNMLR